MITLEELQQQFGYSLLSPEQVNAIREGKVNWQGLDGERILRKCIASFPAYLQCVNFGYQMTPYHYSLAANCQRDYEKGPNPGQAYGLILLSASPQTGKSLTITESFPSWAMIKKPRMKMILLGYAADFASKFGRRNRDKFSEYAPKLTRGRVKIHDKVQSADNWETMVLDMATKVFVSATGTMVTTGMGGTGTGNTGNYVQIDDPIKNMQDAMSETMNLNNVEYYQSVIEPRLLANPGSMACVMCTRWVSNDMIGWLRRTKKKYIVGDYNYAALCTEKNKPFDPLKREVGEGICPEMGLDGKWAQGVIESYAVSGGGHVANALFQGEPTNEKGSLFKDENWGEYEIETGWKPEKFSRIFLSIDATFKDLQTSDYVAMIVGGVMPGKMRLRYAVKKQMDLPDTLDMILKVLKKFPEIDIIYIEDKANGPGIVSVLRKWRKKLGIDEKNFPSIYPVNPEGGKYSRAQTASPFQREMYVEIPCEKDWSRFSCKDDFVWEDEDISFTMAFKLELGTFPFGANDDLVDAFSQAILRNIGLLTGEEKVKKTERFTRYSNWWPEMWDDYKQLKTQVDKNAFIAMHGAPEEWRPKGGAIA